MKLLYLILCVFITGCKQEKILTMSEYQLAPWLQGEPNEYRKQLVGEYICEQSGVKYVKFMELKGDHYLMFNEPDTHSTLTVKNEEIAIAEIQKKARECRERFERAESNLRHNKIIDNQFGVAQIREILRNG